MRAITPRVSVWRSASRSWPSAAGRRSTPCATTRPRGSSRLHGARAGSPCYDEGHLARIERIRSLQARGFTLATIARIVSGELDAADEALVGALTRESLHDEAAAVEPRRARRSHRDPRALLQAIANEGLLVPNRRRRGRGLHGRRRRGGPAGLTLLEQGIPLAELLALARAPSRGHRDRGPPGGRAVRHLRPRAAAAAHDGTPTPTTRRRPSAWSRRSRRCSRPPPRRWPITSPASCCSARSSTSSTSARPVELSAVRAEASR